MKRSQFFTLAGVLLVAASLIPAGHSQSPNRRPKIVLPPPAPGAVVPVQGPRATLTGTTKLLTPDSTIEVRFSSPMVIQWGVSFASLEPQDPRIPIVITPFLKGDWEWRSAESGVYKPSEEPAPGQTYTFTIRDGLKDRSGQPLAPGSAQPKLILKSAGLRVTDRHPTWFSSHDAPRSPRLLLNFSQKVNPATAAKGIHFKADSGLKVKATARLATVADLPERREARREFIRNALAVAGVTDAAPEPDSSLVLPGTLVVAPLEPLPVGINWQLMVAEVASADGKSRLDEGFPIAIGSIEPLAISYANAFSDIGAPKSISLRFNQPLAPDLTPETILSLVTLTPPPPGYKAHYEDQRITLTGTFAHDVKYQVSIAPGLKSNDGRTMPTAYQGEFTFQILEPAIALPGFSVNQLPTGRGLFDIHSVNLKGVRVRVKAAERESLIYALRAYRHYSNTSENNEDNWDGNESQEGFSRIPFDAMPGQKIFEKTFDSAAALDSQDEFTVDWRKALNGRSLGAVFVSVEGEARDEWKGDHRRFGAQAFVQLTDLGMAWKLSGSEAFVLAFSQATGQPLGGVTITSFDSEKNQVGQVVTAPDGTARLPRTDASWLVAERAEDIHAIDLDDDGEDGLGMWRFGVPYEWGPVRSTRREVAVFTERPVYLPGHTVYFKAISRLIDPTGVQLPAAGEKAVLYAYDSLGRLFHQRDVQFSAKGALDGSIELPKGALGYYRLELTLPRLAQDEKQPADADEESVEEGEEPDEEDSRRRSQSFQASFLVEEYKPNTFQLVFDPASFKQEGEKASLSLAANYLLGKPLAKAKLGWTAGVGNHWFQSTAFPDFEFLDSRRGYYWDEEGYHEVPVESDHTDNDLHITGQARTDLSDEGRATLEFPVPSATGTPRPRTITVTAEVTDLNQQTITERWNKTIDSSAFYLGLRTQEDMSAAGEPVTVSLAAARPDGEPWPNPVEARVSVEKINFLSVRVQTVGGGSNVRSEAQRGVVTEGSVTIQPKGTLSQPFSWTPREPGFYYVTARATDPDGRAIESITSVQIYGEGWASWNERDGVRIDLEPDKTSYTSGDTAKILVKSPVTGKALVTLERRSVLKHLSVDITSNAQVIEIPIDDALAPNVFVSVFVLRGSENSPRKHKVPDYKVGFTNLRVIDSKSRLAVAVAPSQTAYRPGDEGSATVTVTDGRGGPVAGAEVTFWAADDGVLTLRAYQPPDVWSQFHQPQPLAVLTGTSLMQLLAEDPQELAFTNKGYMIGGGDDMSDGMNERLRRNFQPVAFFHGALATDASGKVTVPFLVPDNLTRFRLIAVAAAGTDSFGTGQGTFEINKPLMVEPALPRFANVGDEVTAKAVVLNNTDQPLDVEVTLALDALATSASPLTKRVTLAARGTAAVAFPVRFTESGDAAWQWKATSLTPGANLADSVQSSLPVGFAQPILREMAFALLTPTQSPDNVLSPINPELLTGQGTATVTVSNSVMIEAAGAISSLLHYPYGCVEQTTSSTLPWLALERLRETAPWIKKSPQEIQGAIQKGADRLLSMQTTSGGLGYWPGATLPEMWASSYGGMGLALAARSGAVVPRTRLDHLANYLSESLRSPDAAPTPWQLYGGAAACHTLALLGKPEPAYHEALQKHLNIMPHPARAQLALAMLEANAPKADIIRVLDAPIDPPFEEWNENIFDSRLTALNLLVWTRIDPASPVTLALIDRLLRERTTRGDWGSTYENGWALLALAADAEGRVGELKNTRLEVAFAGQKVTVDLPNRAASQTITIPFDEQTQEKTMTINRPAFGEIRLAVEVAARPALVPIQPRTHGFGIQRTYAKVAPDGSTGPADALEIGDLVSVTLDLRIDDHREYLAVDDPLPSIFEAINPAFASQAQTAQPQANPKGPALPLYSTHHELRTDRALFFADSVWGRGNYRVTYLARVIAEGTVTAPPAKIEAMYSPERYGLSGSQRLTSRAGSGKVAAKGQ